MKTLISLTMLAIIGISIAQIFQTDNAIAEFIILGRIPGTSYQLDLLATAAMSVFMLPLVYAWLQTFNAQLVESKIRTIERESIATYEMQVAQSKLESVEEAISHLEIEDLDVISL